MDMKLLLIRHGETQANLDHRISSWAPGEELTPDGLLQAERLVARLDGVTIDGVFASTLTRAQQSAEPLARARGIRLTVVDGLHEIEAGDLEGGIESDQFLAYLAVMGRWGAGDLAAAHPGAFDGHHFLSRFDAGVGEIERAVGPEGTAAVVSHSGSIAVWASGRAENVSTEFASTHHLSNIDVVELHGGTRSGWTATSWGPHREF